MNARAPDGVDSLAVAQEVDVLCDRYEDALRRGKAGTLDDWLPAAGPARTAALVELVRLEMEHRRRGGESVRAEDYIARYPELRADPDAAARLLAAARRGSRLEPPTAVPADTRPTKPPAGGDGPLGTLPAKFGRYRVVKLLGRGGMGTVYQAHDTKLDRPVAVKVLRLDADDPHLVERFYREARIAASFTHPQLCPVYDVGERAGLHYLTMPLLAGETLAAHLRREGPLPERAAAQLAAIIARAIHEAHQAGVVHRDLKPANVMLNERRQPVVMDFGLARRTGPFDPCVTAPGALVGTPAYMPPERISGGGTEGGPAQDVYSLGVMLYEMLTGRLPFDGELHHVLRQVVTKEPEPPSRHRPGLNPRLEYVCLTALAKDPRARYISMEAFAEALEECVPADALPRRPGRSGRLRRWLAAGLIVVLAAVALGVAWFARSHLGSGAATSSSPVAARPMTEPKSEPVADPFQAKSEWDGTFRWEGTDYDRDVKVTITERNGDHLHGVYTADQGAYVWEIDGRVAGDKVDWGFTKVLFEKDRKPVVGVATVQGTWNGDRLTANFRGKDSRADLTLRPAK
jgi:Protein kinase domain